MGRAITVTSVQITDGIVITQAGRTDISVAEWQHAVTSLLDR